MLGIGASAASEISAGANFSANTEWSACAPMSPMDLKWSAVILPSAVAPTLQW